ncbi:MAG: transcriptional regulator [Candidatus Methylomirabilales bacterium]
MTYAQLVGERLRNVRMQKGFSLHEVETESSKEFKASVLGAYERGERSISVPRLQRLARFYGVPADQLLPRDSDDERAMEASGSALPGKVRINLQGLATADGPEKIVLERYLNMIQMQRGDFNGKILTIRNDDFRAVASVLELAPEKLYAKIDGLGLRATVT